MLLCASPIKVKGKTMTNTVKSMSSRGIVLGVALLGAGAVIGISQPAFAQPRADVREERRDVKEARKEVRKERLDVRRSDTRAERHDEREDVRDAREDLREERQELRQERRDNGSWNGNRRDDHHRGYDYNRRYDYNRGYDYNRRDNYNRGYDYNRRNDYGRRSDNGRNDYNRRDFRTVEGIVSQDLRGKQFQLRTSNGQFMLVRIQGREPGRISRGDRVRVYGFFESGFFTASNVNVLRDR
jgi:translation initiation factor IF-1